MKAIRVHAPISKTRINLDSNKGDNDSKDDDDNDGNSSSDDEDNGGGDDDEDDEWNNFLFKGRNAIDLGLSLNPFTGETTFIQRTQDEDHGYKGIGTRIGVIRKDFIRRNRRAESIMLSYN